MTRLNEDDETSFFAKQPPGHVARKYGAERGDWDNGRAAMDTYTFMLSHGCSEPFRQFK